MFHVGCFTFHHHGLRGSASHVLTATGLVHGRGQFFSQQNPHPLSDHQQIWCRWLCRRPLRLCQIWCKSTHRGLLGKWMKYNEFLFTYLFIPFLFGNSPTGQTCQRIFTLGGSNDADSRKGCAFWWFLQGSAETLIRWCGKLCHLLAACMLSMKHSCQKLLQSKDAYSSYYKMSGIFSDMSVQYRYVIR